MSGRPAGAVTGLGVPGSAGEIGIAGLAIGPVVARELKKKAPTAAGAQVVTKKKRAYLSFPARDGVSGFREGKRSHLTFGKGPFHTQASRKYDSSAGKLAARQAVYWSDALASTSARTTQPQLSPSHGE